MGAVKRLMVAAVMAALGTPALAADYATCLLDNLPGVKNAPAHAAALNLCAQQHPNKFFEVRRGSGRGLLSPKSPEQCTLDKARDTSWQPAAGMIMRACGCLYTPSAGPTDMCERYPLSAEIRAQHPLVKTDAELLKLETHYRKIYTAHPDADALFARKDFWTWVTQDKGRESAITKGSTDTVIRTMSEFKSNDWERGALRSPAPGSNPFSDPDFGKEVAPNVTAPPPQAPTARQQAEAKHLQRIYSVHPDADAVVATPEFHSWLSRNSRFRQTPSNGSAEEIILMLNTYKARNKAEERRLMEAAQRRNEAAAESLSRQNSPIYPR